MPTKSRRCYAFAVLVLPLAFGGLDVQARALPPGPLRGPPATAVAATPAIAAAPYAPPETVQAGPGAPRLHIKLTRPADLKLYEVTSRGFSSGTSSPVCAAPCDRVIDGRRGQSFYFNGDHVLKSRKFSLTGHSGDVVAQVKPGRPARRVGGIIGLALGGAGLGTAAFLYWTAKRHADGLNEFREDTDPQAEPNYKPATALLITGAIVAAGGLAMLLLSGTRVKWFKRTAAAKRRLGLG